MRRQLGAGLATAALLLALSSSPAHAATITVTPGAVGINGGDGCSLVEAIINANNNAATHANCVAGSGADTIVLAGNTYSYTTAFGTATALPFITTSITIQANGATIQRAAGAPNMRLLRINPGGNLTLNNATITGGIASFGAGITNYSTLTLNNSTVRGNTASTNGGGISNTSTLTLNNSTVSGNTAASRGGGIYNYLGTVTLNNSTVSGNTGSGFGGGISSGYGIVILNNSTVSGNTVSSGRGGGLANLNGTTTLNNSTVSGNNASVRGGGVYNYLGTTTLARTIVSGNTSLIGAEIGRSGGTITAANRNVFGHSGQTNAQAFFGFTLGVTDITATSDGTTPTALANILNTTLANNGGPTRTHALVAGSPAIDIVPLDGSVCILDTSTDQRGAVRGSGANRGDGACDAGAYEFSSSQTPTAVTNLLTQTTSHPPTTILVLLATLLAAFSGVRLWRRR